MNTLKLIEIVEKADKDYALALVPADTLKKFAEMLIVKCANIIWDEADKKDSAEINEGGYKILDYFGIDWRAEQTEETFGVDSMSTEDKKTLIKELLGVKND